jgi:hypothetical protein
MPIGDVSYQDAALDAVIGSWPASGANWHLFVSDPDVEATPLSVELTAGGGYAAVTFSPAGFDVATAGQAVTLAAVTFGTSTAAYDAVATYWGIVDATGLLVYSDELDTPIEVLAAGTTPAFTPALSFADVA